MEETEAEAVLAVLGPQLEWWQPYPKFPMWHSRDVAGCRYLIHIMHRFNDHTDWHGPYRMIIGREEHDFSPTRYRSMPEAQAACERHYATGKWE